MTTEAQLDSFDRTDTASIEEKAYAAMRTFGITGATADEAYARAYPLRGPRHSTVDSFRVALRHLREDGLIRDSGVRRSNQDGSRTQTVWVLGSDVDRVEADRRKKLHKVPTDWLIDELKRRNAMPPGLSFSVGASPRVPSADLKPGDRLCHTHGTGMQAADLTVELARRKQAHESSLTGWWLVGGGGLADRVIDDPNSGWTVIP